MGSHLLLELAKKGQPVRALKRPGSDLQAVKRTFSWWSDDADRYFSRIEWAEADVLDLYSLLDALDGVEHVYHSAALVSFLPGDAKRMIETNTEGTANVVNACLEKRVRKLCHVSSIAALGIEGNNKLITEDAPWKAVHGRHMYAISKYGAEREVWRGMEEGLDAVIVNPGVIIGPGNWRAGSPSLVRLGSKGLRWYASGSSGYVDVRDVACAMIRLMHSELKSDRFILTSENLSHREFFSMMAREFGKKEPRLKAGKLILEIAWRAEKVRAFVRGKRSRITKDMVRAGMHRNSFSNKKIRQALGMEFRPVRETVKEVCAIYKKDRD